MKRVTPAVESEKTILGAILLDNSVVRDIADKLCPKDFAVYFHEELFEAIIRLHKKHGSVDVPMIVTDLKICNEHEGYVYNLANECPSTANVKAHADIVKEKSVQRHLLALVDEVKEKKKEKVNQIEHLASFLEETAAEIRSTNVDEHYLHCTLFEISKGFISTEIGLQNEKS